MKRTILLLIPLLATAVAEPQPAERVSKQETMGQLWQASVAAESSGDRAAALEKLEAFSKAGGDPYFANLRAAWLNYGAGKHDEAARLYLAASKVQKNALSPQLGLLNVAQAKNDVAAAAKAAEGVLRIEPTNYRALMAVAWGAFQAKDYRKSGLAYQRVLGIYPEDQDAISGAAWCALYTSQKREAATGFQRLMTLNPDYAHLREGIQATSR